MTETGDRGLVGHLAQHPVVVELGDERDAVITLPLHMAGKTVQEKARDYRTVMRTLVQVGCMMKTTVLYSRQNTSSSILFYYVLLNNYIYLFKYRTLYNR